MKSLNVFSILFAAIGLVTGLRSSWFWLQASHVEADPMWKGRGPEDAWGWGETGEADAVQDRLIFAMIDANTKSSELNKVAARWTAITIVMGSLSAMLAALAGIV
ncbi:MAG TPA: hypothetical protein VHZ09_14260 [Acidobacteriaceae bacterium]|jgi:hypothetical protein|nr:hypothetical protein [Acidobacteriaceae bacterium]